MAVVHVHPVLLLPYCCYLDGREQPMAKALVLATAAEMTPTWEAAAAGGVGAVVAATVAEVMSSVAVAAACWTRSPHYYLYYWMPT